MQTRLEGAVNCGTAAFRGDRTPGHPGEDVSGLRLRRMQRSGEGCGNARGEKGELEKWEKDPGENLSSPTRIPWKGRPPDGDGEGGEAQAAPGKG